MTRSEYAALEIERKAIIQAGVPAEHRDRLDVIVRKLDTEDRRVNRAHLEVRA
jgi:hypothetical protein